MAKTPSYEETFCRDLTNGPLLQVLAETQLPDQPGRLFGTCSRYCPVEFQGVAEHIGRIVPVIAGQIANGRIQATFCSEFPR